MTSNKENLLGFPCMIGGFRAKEAKDVEGVSEKLRAPATIEWRKRLGIWLLAFSSFIRDKFPLPRKAESGKDPFKLPDLASIRHLPPCMTECLQVR